MIENGNYCTAAVGFGEISVMSAGNTTATDGGSLAIEDQGIPVFHPASTPVGDASGYFEQLCPVE